MDANVLFEVIVDLIKSRFDGMTTEQKIALAVSIIKLIVAHYKAAEAAKTAAQTANDPVDPVKLGNK